MTTPRLKAGQTAFLDRDGTINEPPAEGDYVTSPGQVRLLPGAGAAVRRLNRLPAPVVVVTNQRGIALGLMGEEDLAAVNARLEDLLAAEGAHLDAILHCPHEKGGCDCRKPGTGMFERATRELDGVTVAGAAMIGDAAIDIEAGNRLGLTTVRLGTSAEGDPPADLAASDLAEAVRLLTGD